MTCNCDQCEDHRRLHAIAANLPKDEANFLWDLMNRFEHAGMDLNWHQAIADGSWPTAEMILTGWLHQAQKRKQEAK